MINLTTRAKMNWNSMRRTRWFASFAALAPLAMSPQAMAQDTSTVAVDQSVWLTFHDVPSRRFVEVRRALVRGELDAARGDLVISAGHLQVEAGRAAPEIGERLMAVSERLLWLADNIDDPRAAPAEFDAQFGRAHWLLAQHYLYEARLSRNRGDDRLAGRYLWAATHHMERAVLWSNARIDRRLRKTLDDLRTLATRLQDDSQASRVRGQRPIVKAETVLLELGEKIDRPVVLRKEAN